MASGESKGSRRYDKENLLWQSTVAITLLGFVLVYVRQPNPDGRLVPESAATLVLSVAAQGVLPWVPPQALIEDGDGSFVYVVEDGNATLRAVEESARLPDRVFIKSGLKAGETVIVGGTHKVSDGAAVTCKEAK